MPSSSQIRPQQSTPTQRGQSLRTNAPPLLVWPVLVAIQFLFAGWHVLGKLAFSAGCNPFVFALYRELLASTFMWIGALVWDGLIVPHRRHVWLILLMGSMSFVNVVFSAVALDMVSAPNVAMLQPVVPVFALMISIVLKIEILTWVKALGMVVSVSGALLLVFWTTEDSGESRQILLGNILLVCQCIAGSLLVVLFKFVIGSYPHVTITAWYYSFGTLLSAITVGVVVSDREDFNIRQREVWLAIAYAFLFATVFNYIAMTWTSKHVNPSVTTGFLTLQPVATVILSSIFLSFQPKLPHLAAAVAVVVGLLVTCYGQYLDAAQVNAGDAIDRDDRSIIATSVSGFERGAVSSNMGEGIAGVASDENESLLEVTNISGQRGTSVQH
mmetsp:Transcript_14963/g.26903  ORF Transcript_14963/g.26903 Transcript_14963/m.26903 type:complete len:386 (+) Transcript_14963:121-1278(+)|eukprot:CAMPEP_0197540300 /NCGR_PEP_ID=MMETSP1318-20131121/65368_1 /TAXON_ID=552666 /ORGANISM="Partenskyella glossopodia, Strain RCC365" /LENGTH=385 /DNA_ID=CAMNT_0043099243 /DNA_START=36 /DNA_END=1193 /DNA_ORIENTATION=-